MSSNNTFVTEKTNKLHIGNIFAQVSSKSHATHPNHQLAHVHSPAQVHTCTEEEWQAIAAELVAEGKEATAEAINEKCQEKFGAE